jgi:hypothetical protein
MMRAIRILTTLAIFAGIALAGSNAYAAPHCTVTAGTPHIEYIDNNGNAVIQGVAGLSSCVKGKPAISYTLNASMGDQSGTVTKACSTVTRFACGTSLILETTFVCTDSDDPATLTVRTEANGVVSPWVTFDCSYYGGGE